ncbi:MAG: helix-turn-helix domain-containing protein, partial [Pseudomonadota bacterium]|nr:helix-turn-helix domain-containing protein [Pseudomonadota bacterium]
MHTEISNGEQIVRRMLTVIQADKETELAKYLDVSKQTVYSWKSRGSVPLNYCAEFAIKSGASLDFLRLGFDTHLLRREQGFSNVGEIHRLEDLSLETLQGIQQDTQYTEIPLYDVE